MLFKHSTLADPPWIMTSRTSHTCFRKWGLCLVLSNGCSSCSEGRGAAHLPLMMFQGRHTEVLEWPMCVSQAQHHSWLSRPGPRRLNKKPHSRHRRRGMAHLSVCVWQCKGLKSSMAIFTGAAIRDWQNKAILWGWIHTKVCFSDPTLKFPMKTPILTAQGDIGIHPPVFLHKGQSFKAAPHSFRKIWGCNRK